VPELLSRVRPRWSASLAWPAIAAWIGVVLVGREMGSMPGTMGLGVVAFAAVWALMMTAMMLPSVTPFAAVYSRTFGERRGPRRVAFISGYLVIWAVTASPVYALARAADRLVANHPTGATAFAVVAFAACGAYQLTSIKDRCLAWCRSPLGFTAKYSAYRGRTRDFRVGAHHGAYCLGCCWALMAMLLAFGLMNLGAMAVLTLVVFVERTQPWGPRLGRLVGVAALGMAFAVIVHPALAPGLHHNPQPSMTMDPTMNRDM
jgi:predicted metal-binding membrane protein